MFWQNSVASWVVDIYAIIWNLTSHSLKGLRQKGSHILEKIGFLMIHSTKNDHYILDDRNGCTVAIRLLRTKLATGDCMLKFVQLYCINE